MSKLQPLPLPLVSECGGIENLPDDLVMEIIARSCSCSRSATRYKSVCKRWLNLITTPPFVHRFLSLHPPQEYQTLGVILQLNTYNINNRSFPCETIRVFARRSPFSLSLSFLPCRDHKKVWILASFNDLLVCSPTIYSHSVYYFCNPVTKQFLVLPPHPLLFSKQIGPYVNAKIHFALVCDPYCNNAVINPGYTFKLFCLHDASSVDMFSSETGKWSAMTMRGTWEGECRHIKKVVVFKGMVLWEKPGASRLEGFDTRCCPEGEGEVRVFEFGPPLPTSIYIRRWILSRDGCVYLWEHVTGGLFQVWELKGEKWSSVREVLFQELHCEDERLSSTWEASRLRHYRLRFHPTDRDTAYFRPLDEKCTLMCNLTRGIVEVDGEGEIEGITWNIPVPWRDPAAIKSVFPLVLPAWPTPIPILPPTY